MYLLLGLRSWTSSRLPPPADVKPFVLPNSIYHKYLTGKSGKFYPCHDYYYYRNAECSWFIEVPKGYYVKVTFYNVDIE